MNQLTITRLLAVASLLAATACTPVFSSNERVAFSSVAFPQSSVTPIVIGQR